MSSSISTKHLRLNTLSFFLFLLHYLFATRRKLFWNIVSLLKFSGNATVEAILFLVLHNSSFLGGFLLFSRAKTLPRPFFVGVLGTSTSYSACGRGNCLFLLHCCTWKSHLSVLWYNVFSFFFSYDYMQQNSDFAQHKKIQLNVSLPIREASLVQRRAGDLIYLTFN